ncbi:MAG TPA: hypothetical protein VI306_09110 [Pyrinomonadaceae bacterium]
MPTKFERIRVMIKETSDLEVRTFNITLIAPTGDFQLTDLLRQRGVISGLDVELKHSLKRTTEEYLQSAESLVSGLASKQLTTKRLRKDSRADGEAIEPDSTDSSPRGS